MRYWVLRERSTNRLMPINKVATRAEFSDDGPPRLFTSAGAAKQALDCWRMGHWSNVVDSYGEGEGPMPPDPSRPWHAKIIERRKNVGVDIVPMRLVSARASLITSAEPAALALCNPEPMSDEELAYHRRQGTIV